MANFQTARQLKIAIFSDDFTPQSNDVSAYAMARGLASEGAEVNVFSLKNSGELDFEAIDGIVVHRSGAINLTKPLHVYGLVAPKLVPQSYGCLKDNPPDIIHAFGTTFSALVAAGVSRMLKHPLVTTLQPNAAEEQPLRRRVPAFAYQRSLGRAIIGASDRVVCTSPAGVVQAAKFGARSERTIMQPYAAGANDFVRQTIDVYVDALAERELRWFLQHQAA